MGIIYLHILPCLILPRFTFDVKSRGMTIFYAFEYLTGIRTPSQWYRQTPFTNNEKLIKRATWTNNKDKPRVSISCSASRIRGVYCQIIANYSHNQVRWLRSFYENGTTSTVICEINHTIFGEPTSDSQSQLHVWVTY